MLTSEAIAARTCTLLPKLTNAKVLPSGNGIKLYKNPIAMPGNVNRSGSQRSSASNAARAISSQQKIIRPTVRPNSNEKAVPGKSIAQARNRHAMKDHVAATASSTRGYRQLMGAPHVRQRPRSAIQLTNGTFSHHARVRPQLMQCERGWTMLSPSGQRLRHTFRKLPKASPRSPAKRVPRTRIIEEIEYTALMSRA